MGLAYLKTFHGVLSLVQVLLGLVALVAGFLLWNADSRELYWLFFMGARPLVSVVLAILVLTWLTGLAVLVQQLFVKDLLEQMGKTKLLLLHASIGLLVLAAAVIETYYLSQPPGASSAEQKQVEGTTAKPEVDTNGYYMPRLIFVMVSCWLLFVTYVGQFIFTLLQ